MAVLLYAWHGMQVNKKPSALFCFNAIQFNEHYKFNKISNQIYQSVTPNST